MFKGLALALLGLVALFAAPHSRAADATARAKSIGPARIAVGGATLPLFVSMDWTRPQPAVTRAVLVLPGHARDARAAYRVALASLQAAGPAGRGSLMIVPHFLAGDDVAAADLPPEMLRWTVNGWERGDPAEGPEDASSFDALDAILAHLADRRVFPGLRLVVIAGHSGGGQMVQRYAIAAKADAALSAAGIGVHYVVANASAFTYFDGARPMPPVAGSCPRLNEWAYGMEHRPPYLALSSARVLEAAYLQRDVTYLVGALDRNPAHPGIDRSCMAESQGPTRFDRAHNYFAQLRARTAGALGQRLVEVPDVGHDENAMFTSNAGVAALFGGP